MKTIIPFAFKSSLWLSGLLILLVQSLFYQISFGQTYSAGPGGSTVATYTEPGNHTFQIPIGTTSYIIEAWGGGGGGTTFPIYRGGGGSAYTRSVSLTPSQFSTLEISLGVGGFQPAWINDDLATPSRVQANGTEILVANAGRWGRDFPNKGLTWSGPYVEVSYEGGNAANENGGGGGSAFTTGPGQNGLGPAGGDGAGRGGWGGTNYLEGEQPGGGGGYFMGRGGNGLVRITFFCTPQSQLISLGSNIYPNPQELKPDTIRHISGLVGSGSKFLWERSSTSTGPWTILQPTGSQLAYTDTNYNQTVFFRRLSNECAYQTPGNLNWNQLSASSNAVALTIVQPNGKFRGRITNKSGSTGIKNCTIKVKKVRSIDGSPANFEYVTTTNDDGYFSFPRIFYGNPDPLGQQDSVSFIITPSRGNDMFDPPFRIRKLSTLEPEDNNVNFKDTTGWAILGKVYQRCVGCQNEDNSGTTTVQAPLDSVSMRNGSQVFMLTQFLSSPAPGGSGRFALSVQEPGNYTISPLFKNHSFTPPNRIINVNGNDVANVDFEDVTTRTVSGYFRAGCMDRIGTALLEFQDVVKDEIGNIGTPTFRKRVETDVNGLYTISLPSRRYRVRIIDFYPTISDASHPDYINPEELKQFFNANLDGKNLISSALPFDSVSVDLFTQNKTLNLRYQRKPSIQIVSGLDSVVCGGQKLPFAQLQQAVKSPYSIKVFQGSPSKNCPVNTNIAGNDSLKIETSVPVENIPVFVKMRIKAGLVSDTMVAGTPNILSPYTKNFILRFTDAYGRQAIEVSRPVLVTGIQSTNGGFTTVSPEIPLMVLHDPPGGNSYARWEQNISSERALRFSAGKENGTESWVDVKVGTSFEAGIGVSTETSLWAQVSNRLNLATRTNSANEMIWKTTTSNFLETDQGQDIVGDDADLFQGIAVNLKYSVADEVKLDGCTPVKTRSLVVAPDGFPTQFRYTKYIIQNRVIPDLDSLSIDPNQSPAQRERYADQKRVWEQILANNEKNKQEAAFQSNISFSGGASSGSSLTTSTTKTNTVEFNLEISADVAAELGFDIAGSGVSGGVNIRMKMETGRSETISNMVETTTGYVLQDNDIDNAFTVGVYRDPVYNTPVFKTVAGFSSCPHESNTINLNALQLSAPNGTVRSNVAPNSEAQFTLRLGNSSVATGSRTYRLSLDNGSNSDGAQITIAGQPVGENGLTFNIPQNQSVNVTVGVKRNLFNNVYSYPNLRFVLSDNCSSGSNISQTIALTAHFQSPCSEVVLLSPQANWVCRQSNNQIIPISFNGYNAANLTRIVGQYSIAGLNDWQEAFTRTAAQLVDPLFGTTVNWNVASLTDRNYDFRLKVECIGGSSYTQIVQGTIDRQGPQLLGKPQPSDDRFDPGDEISFAYNENLGQSGIVSLIRLSNGQIIPSSFTHFQNKLIVNALENLLIYAGESFRVIAGPVSDQWNNLRAQSDTLQFQVAGSLAFSGPRLVQMVLENGSVYENSGQSLAFRFEIAEADTFDRPLQFQLGGFAQLGVDFQLASSASHNQNQWNGSGGVVVLPKNQTSVSLIITPIGNTQSQPDRFVTVSLLAGGDYVLGLQSAAIGMIQDDDVEAPQISQPTGTYPGPISVELTSSKSQAKIYYTTSGNVPVVGTTFTKLYTGPFAVIQNTTIRAMAVWEGVATSGISVSYITISAPGIVSTPVITPGTGSYTGQQSVTINCSTGGARILYTTNGNVPVAGTSFTREYSGPFVLNGSATVRAIGVKDGIQNSAVAVAYLNINPSPVVANPVISPGTGSFSGPQQVSISCATAGATIYYTTNGNVPRLDVPNSFTKVYAGSFTLAGSATIRALAVAPGLVNSGVSVAYLTILPARKAVEEIDSPATDLLVYPNPSSGLFHWKKADFSEGKMQVLSLTGQVILEKEISEANQDETINLSQQAPGLYILRLEQNHQVHRMRLIKQ